MPGVSYRFRVAVRNKVGESVPSKASQRIGIGIWIPSLVGIPDLPACPLPVQLFLPIAHSMAFLCTFCYLKEIYTQSIYLRFIYWQRQWDLSIRTVIYRVECFLNHHHWRSWEIFGWTFNRRFSFRMQFCSTKNLILVWVEGFEIFRIAKNNKYFYIQYIQ